LKGGEKVTFQELFCGNILSGQQASVKSPGANDNAASKTVSAGSFKSILENKVSMNNANENAIKPGPSESTDKAENAAEPKYRTFLDAKRSQKQSRVKASGQGSGREDEAVVIQEEKQEDLAETVGLIAGILCVGTAELDKLLDEAGIVLEPLDEAYGIIANVSKLSELLNLDKSQQDALEQLFLMAKDAMMAFKIGEEAPEVVPVLSEQGGDAEGPENLQEIPADDGFLLIEAGEAEAKLIEHIKSKLSKYIRELNGDRKAAEQSVREALKPFITDISVKSDKPHETTFETVAVDTEQPESAGDIGKKAVKNTESETMPEAGLRKGPGAEEALLRADESKTQPAFAAVEPQEAVRSQFEHVLTERAEPVSPRQVISQTIEKASLMLTPEKSEMTIDLKPESLGRLSLKIASENGVITARFIAESYQVKQVLESNLEVLKDTLQRQGVNVEGFSVFVRQDSGQAAQHFSRRWTGDIRRAEKAYVSAGIESATAGLYGAETVNNPFSWDYSTINLTA